MTGRAVDAAGHAREEPYWVLDTNAVLDWLVFDDPGMRAAAAWLQAGRARWVCTAAMLEEIAEVAGRPQFARWPQAAHVARLCAHHAHVVEPAQACTLRCADPDDQMFLDLALHIRADCLLSRDRALLELAPQAARLGLRIARPRDFAPTADA